MRKAGELPNAAPWTTDVACSDAVDALYTIPAGSGARGSIVGCAAGEVMDAAAVQAQLTDGGAEGVVAQTGARIVRVAYRTVRSDGTSAVTTATVYLPVVPRAVGLPNELPAPPQPPEPAPVAEAAPAEPAAAEVRP